MKTSALLASLLARRDAYIGVNIASVECLAEFFRLATACVYLEGRAAGRFGYAAGYLGG